MVSSVRKVTRARVMKSSLYDSQVRDHVVHLCLNVNSGCMVDGGGAMVAI